MNIIEEKMRVYSYIILIMKNQFIFQCLENGNTRDKKEVNSEVT